MNSLTPKDHARLSASGSSKWMVCAGAPAMEEALPDQSSVYAEEGTVYHEVMSQCLMNDLSPDEFLGRQYRVVNGKIYDPLKPVAPADIRSDNTYTVDADMVDYAHDGLEVFDDFTSTADEVYIETRVDFSEDIGVPDSFGTSDVTAVFPEEITIIDWKYGIGVRVDAEENSQGMHYGLGALRRLTPAQLARIKRVRLVIFQPRLDHLSEWDCSIEHIRAFAGRARLAAARCDEAQFDFRLRGMDEKFVQEFLVPGEKQCKFCKAKSFCPALRNKAMNEINADFDALMDDGEDMMSAISQAVDRLPGASPEYLGRAFAAAPLVEIWLKGVREGVMFNIANGIAIPGTKVVRGKQGNRKWKNDFAAELVLDAYGVPDDRLYKRKVVSPTDAEKLLKKEKPWAWFKIQGLITRSEGALSVALVDDKREAVDINDIEDDFMALDDGDDE